MNIDQAFYDNAFDSFTISVLDFGYDALADPPVKSYVHRYKENDYDYIFFDLDETDTNGIHHLDMYIIATDTNG